MKVMYKRSLFMGALAMALAVGLGAFGAHGLEGILTAKEIDVYSTGNFYHFVHGIGILLCSVMLHFSERKTLVIAYRLFLIGIVVFSGSLYLLSVSSLVFGEQVKWLGAITPLGGLSFIAGWVCMALAAIQKNPRERHQTKNHP